MVKLDLFGTYVFIDFWLPGFGIDRHAIYFFAQESIRIK
ncbi:hypothetical protein NC99_08260 [Sunxiuqinia dokdonensis]|uniref:Uncharacterized protein n=1 Tax=Sunxiuqinia dokdonensis TaxID=1409788 RepID=A0A0L8VD20_9BACT|nr:hypothetical protein NC99_08260 [Sunxiuqinia dokdonensis]